MRIALAGAGAFGEKHLDGLKTIDGVEITSIISRRLEQAEEEAVRGGQAPDPARSLDLEQDGTGRRGQGLGGHDLGSAWFRRSAWLR